LVSSTGSFYPGEPATSLFNGDISNSANPSSGGGSSLTFTPPSTLTYSSTVEIYTAASGTHSFNGGTAISHSAFTWTTIASGSGTVSSIVVTGINYPAWLAVRIDGKILVDSGITPPNVPSIASTVRANPSAGFSIVSYTGNDTAGATVGHGLSAAPEFIIFKNRDNAYNWTVLHRSLNITGGEAINLNQSNAKYTSIAQFNSTLPTSTVFTLGTGGNTNYQSGDDFIAYCFAPVDQYSSFGSYLGNGSADGPFVFTGFKIRWLMVKSSSNSGEHWHILDTERDPINLASQTLYANLTNAESTFAAAGIDIVSNGFKVKGTNPGVNGNGYTYIYIAFASHPFKTARAR
jgi:hypothetical protein